MARLLLNGEWYEEIASRAMYEAEFSSLFQEHASTVFPGYHVSRFDPLVISEYGTAKPDLVLVENEFRSWWVVEVEMAHHSLHGHVLPQVRSLAHGAYDETHADYIRGKLPHLNRERLIEMMRGRQPRVLIVVNAPVPSWTEPLNYLQAEVALFEIFRSRAGKMIYRINGFRPELPADVLSDCVCDPFIPKLLQIASPAALPVRPGEETAIRIDERWTSWKRLDSRDTVYLVPLSGNPLFGDREYELLRNSAGELLLRDKPKPNRKGRK